MSEQGLPAVTGFEMSSGDPDHAHQMLRETYAEFTARLAGRVRDFRFTLAGAATTEITIGHSLYGAAADMDVSAPPGRFLVASCRRGRASFEAGRAAITPGPDTPVLMPPDRGYRAVLEDVTIDVVSLATDAVDRQARSLFGPDAPRLRFTALTAISPAAAAYWQHAVNHVRNNLLTHPAVMAHPLARDDATRSLATAALVVFPHTAHALLDPPGPGWVEPAALRRALAYIDEHAGEEIDDDDVAAAARLDVPGLRALFRRHHGRTPAQHLHQTRMHRAHTDLRSADPARGDTVAGIAARWGFTDTGHFHVAYQRLYGRPPGDTLRR